jgi:hypothetical protein
MGDVEYISELLAALISGPQNKKKSLDFYYQSLAEWRQEERVAIVGEFNSVLSDLEAIFPTSHPISSTRYFQKSDFYSLFLAISSERREGGTLTDKDLKPLRADLGVLHERIGPSSEVKLLAEYAVHCVSDANSESSGAGVQISCARSFREPIMLSRSTKSVTSSSTSSTNS